MLNDFKYEPFYLAALKGSSYVITKQTFFLVFKITEQEGRSWLYFPVEVSINRLECFDEPPRPKLGTA